MRGFDHTVAARCRRREELSAMARRREPSGRRSALVARRAVMVAASFAAVPFYTWFCQVTGYGGTTDVAGAPDAEVVDRTVTVALRRQRRARHAVGVPARSSGR